MTAHPARKPCTRYHHHLFLSPSSRPLNVLQLYCRRCQWRILNSSLRRRRAEQVWLQSYSKINAQRSGCNGNIPFDSSHRSNCFDPYVVEQITSSSCRNAKNFGDFYLSQNSRAVAAKENGFKVSLIPGKNETLNGRKGRR